MRASTLRGLVRVETALEKWKQRVVMTTMMLITLM